MKANVLFKMAVVAVLAISTMQSCTKDEDPIKDVQELEEASFTVRPDFATLDTRPADVIAEHKVAGEQAEPVALSTLKASGGKYALVIGISDYYGSSSDLQYCDDDAVDWYYQLRDEGYSIRYLLDHNATKTAIQNEVSYLASLSAAGNEIAFCYSGHGSQGNVVTADMYYINYQWFTNTFANATSTKMMFCFDACQIGAMKALDAPGRVVAVASNQTLLSYDGNSSMRNGVFTYYMMKGFDQVGYNYLEPDCDYAISNMQNWASYNNLSVAPSYADSYAGNFEL